MNTLARSACLSLLHQRVNSSARQVSKMNLYRLFRCLGTRLYSTEAWMKSSTCSIMPTSNTQLVQTQCISTTAVNMNLKEKIKERLRKMVAGDKLKNKYALRLTSVRLYLSCTNALLYNEIQNYVTLPNSFSTWHKLVGLHIWMVMTRLVVEDKPGTKIKKLIITAFNEDTQHKITDLGDKLELRVKGEEVDQLNQQFMAALFAYDEGLLHSDRLLAGALWRVLFNQAEDVDPCDLDTMVHYVRKNIKLIHNLDRNHLLTNGMIPFLPVKGDSIPKQSYDLLTKVSESNLELKT